MSKAVRVPDPVYKRIDAEAERQDVSRGAIVQDWMQAYDKLERIEEDFLHSMETRGGGDE